MPAITVSIGSLDGLGSKKRENRKQFRIPHERCALARFCRSAGRFALEEFTTTELESSIIIGLLSEK